MVFQRLPKLSGAWNHGPRDTQRTSQSSPESTGNPQDRPETSQGHPRIAPGTPRNAFRLPEAPGTPRDAQGPHTPHAHYWGNPSLARAYIYIYILHIYVHCGKIVADFAFLRHRCFEQLYECNKASDASMAEKATTHRTPWHTGIK